MIEAKTHASKTTPISYFEIIEKTYEKIWCTLRKKGFCNPQASFLHPEKAWA